MLELVDYDELDFFANYIFFCISEYVDIFFLELNLVFITLQVELSAGGSLNFDVAWRQSFGTDEVFFVGLFTADVGYV